MLLRVLKTLGLLGAVWVFAGCGGSSGSPKGSGGPVYAVPPGASGMSASNGDRVRITAIDGQYRPTHPMDIYVHAGDVVTLSADLFLARTGFQPAGLPVEAFVWSSSLGPQDRCDASAALDCLGHSNFQLSNYGISYYVPFAMPQSIQLTVQNLPSLPGQGPLAPMSDSITLHNMDFGDRVQMAPALVLNPANFPGKTLDPNLALLGMGRWVVVGEQRYFTPYSYVATGEDAWAPYRHGYWAWENNGGMTWISYDPWGWMTEHYGVWRHHGTYGWLWMPFSDRHYEPHCVSWFHSEEHIGWYPYVQRLPQMYRAGGGLGFDDGLWLGYQVGLNVGTPNYAYFPGFVVVPRGQIASPNIVNVMIANRLMMSNPAALVVIQNAFAQRQVYAFPGGDQVSARSFIEFHGQPLPLTEVRAISTHGGAQIMAATPVHPVPNESIAFLHQMNPLNHPLPVGAVARNQNGAITVVPPSLNGRGLVAAPIIRNEAGKVVGVMPVRTSHPFELQPGSHLGATASVARTLPVHALPALDPKAQTPPARLPGLPSAPAVRPSAPVVHEAPVRHEAPRAREIPQVVLPPNQSLSRGHESKVNYQPQVPPVAKPEKKAEDTKVRGEQNPRPNHQSTGVAPSEAVPKTEGDGHQRLRSSLEVSSRNNPSPPRLLPGADRNLSH